MHNNVKKVVAFLQASRFNRGVNVKHHKATKNEKLTAAPSPVSVAASAPKFHPVAGAAGSENATMKNSKLPWKMEGNLIKCADGYSVGSINSHKTTEGAANAELTIKAANEHAALVAVAEAFDKWYLESSHLCELTDEVNANPERKDELCLLRNLLNASKALASFREGGAK